MDCAAPSRAVRYRMSDAATGALIAANSGPSMMPAAAPIEAGRRKGGGHHRQGERKLDVCRENEPPPPRTTRWAPTVGPEHVAVVRLRSDPALRDPVRPV